MIQNESYLLALHSIDGLGPIRLKTILQHFQDPKLAWEANGEELLKLGIYKNIVKLLTETRKKLEPETYTKKIAESGIKWITVLDKNYPKLLAQIYDPPTVLYYKGKIDLNEKTIGVVGTRKITDYGKVVTEQFTKELVQAGFIIVSGLALGVDTQAHLTTISENGQTIAVLGGGLNNIFPSENKGLVAKITRGFGAVISEFPPDSPPLPGNFPARNRIISGLSLGVLVIEAAENSGSLITARLALEQGREVFAVPGSIASKLSKGSSRLIKNGATAVFCADEVLEELGVSNQSNYSGGSNLISQGLSEKEKKILECLGEEEIHIDEISRRLNFDLQKVSALLLKLEISGLVQSTGAGIYCKK
ncbi:DNA-processing protein DprA [Patescibacteria group bacterium]|nr:DNA-processing protein DprA [Patescibacteria group bacterium]